VETEDVSEVLGNLVSLEPINIQDVVILIAINTNDNDSCVVSALG
jgi:hypothetical protein